MARPLTWILGPLVVAPAIAACSALVDTGGLAGTAELTDAATTSAEAGSDAEAGSTKDGATTADPCADTTLAFCEPFDGPSALGRFTKDTDPSTSITVDGTGFVSAPSSARFEIEPSSDGSPDATLQVMTKASLARAAVDAWVMIERGETAQSGRLFLMNVGDQGNLFIERDGSIHVENVVAGAVAAPPSGKWFLLHVEVSTDVTPPTVVVELDGARSKAIPVDTGTWAPGPVFVRFGISEASSPNIGWLVRWDDVRVKSF